MQALLSRTDAMPGRETAQTLGVQRDVSRACRKSSTVLTAALRPQLDPRTTITTTAMPNALRGNASAAGSIDSHVPKFLSHLVVHEAVNLRRSRTIRRGHIYTEFKGRRA